MNEIERGEVDKANDLFKRHEVMIEDHLAGKALWDNKLHNETMIQLQIAWPIAFSAITSGLRDDT